MRLALALGKTRRELLDSIGADELKLWEVFEALYDLPDGYHASGALGPVVLGALGARSSRMDFVPYHRPPPRPKDPGACARTLQAFVHVAKGLGKRRR